MDKKQLSYAFTVTPVDALAQIAQNIMQKYQTLLLREAKQTLVMVKVREHIGQSLFYLGEVLCSTCQVEVAGHAGISVLIGHDLAKAASAAVIDAAQNANIPELPEIFTTLQNYVDQDKRRREARSQQVESTRVDFQIMQGS